MEKEKPIQAEQGNAEKGTIPALQEKFKELLNKAKAWAVQAKTKLTKKEADEGKASSSGSKNALSKVLQKAKQESGRENLVSNILEQKGKVKEDDQIGEVNKILVRQTVEQLFWSRVTSAVALGVLIISLLVNWIALSEGNSALGLLGISNYTVSEKNLQAEQKKVAQKYDEVKSKYDALLTQDSSTDAVMLAEIMEKKIYWTDEMQLINKVIARISPYNPVTKKVAISQYTFDTEAKKISIAGYLQNESEDRIYSLIANAVDAFSESPYFTGVSLSQFSASEQDLGNYASPLRLTFYVQDAEDKEDNQNFLATDYSKRRYRHSGYQMSGVLTEVVYPTATEESGISMHAAPVVAEEKPVAEEVEAESEDVAAESVTEEGADVLGDSFGFGEVADEAEIDSATEETVTTEEVVGVKTK